MPTHISYAQCSGEELNLLDCSYSRNHEQNDHSKDLGIQCRKGMLLKFTIKLHRFQIVVRELSKYTVTCDDGDLRLFGVESESKGLLEVCFSQRWGTVNGDGWTSSDTQVACRQLGYEGDERLRLGLKVISSPFTYHKNVN